MMTQPFGKPTEILKVSTLTTRVVGKTKAGKDICEVCGPPSDGSSAFGPINNNDSGDTKGVSCNGEWVAVLDELLNGNWWAVNVNTKECVLIGGRNESGNGVAGANTNIVWTETADRFWFISGGVLELRNVAGNVFQTVNLPGPIIGPDGNSHTPLYTNETCSGHEVPGTILKVWTPAGEGFQIVNPDGTLEPIAWIVDAYNAGVAAGTAPTDDVTGNPYVDVIGIHNIECTAVGGGGILGGLKTLGSSDQQTQQIYVWIPLDGSTMVQLTNEQASNVTNIWTHPCSDDDFVLTGNNSQGQIDIFQISNPPTTVDETNPLCRFNKTQLQQFFTSQNVNGYALWHCHIINGHAIISILDTNTNEVLMAYVDTSNLPSCPTQLECVVDGLENQIALNPGPDSFYYGTRPTISKDGSTIVWHDVNESGDRCIYFARR